jgi:hypothetical protein
MPSSQVFRFNKYLLPAAVTNAIKVVFMDPAREYLGKTQNPNEMLNPIYTRLDKRKLGLNT